VGFQHRVPFWRPLLYPGIWDLKPFPPQLNQQVILSFDDGPSDNTLSIAKTLQEKNLRGIFFISAAKLPPVGLKSHTSDKQKRAADILVQLSRGGHTIANHGLDHKRLGYLPAPIVRNQIVESQLRIESACGIKPKFFRPPFGNWFPWLNKIPQALGLTLFFWSLNPRDYAAKNPLDISQCITNNVCAGDIILHHCSGKGEKHTLAALTPILDSLKDLEMCVLDPASLLELVE
jgi:peptidoglycan-N-acetylglucosamine deacetylase